jgi:hypothetical protein
MLLVVNRGKTAHLTATSLDGKITFSNAGIEMKAIIFFIILSLFTPYAIADEASRKAAAEELIILSNPDQILEQVWAQVGSMFDQQFQQMGAPEEFRPVFKKYTDKMFKVLEAELSFQNMKDDMISMYVKTFTESEIRGISEFYKSPAGRAFLEKRSKLLQESMAMTQKRMPQIMPKIQAISQEMARELKSLKDQQQSQ